MPDIRSEAFSRKEARIQENEGFAIIWREAQRKRGELIGLWFSQIFNRLWKLHRANSFALDPSHLPPHGVANLRKPATAEARQSPPWVLIVL